MTKILKKKPKTLIYNVLKCIIIDHIHLFTFLSKNSLQIVSFPGCILCELLTGYPLLPGEDEGEPTVLKLILNLSVAILALLCSFQGTRMV